MHWRACGIYSRKRAHQILGGSLFPISSAVVPGNTLGREMRRGASRDLSWIDKQTLLTPVELSLERRAR